MTLQFCKHRWPAAYGWQIAQDAKDQPGGLVYCAHKPLANVKNQHSRLMQDSCCVRPIPLACSSAAFAQVGPSNANGGAAGSEGGTGGEASPLLAVDPRALRGDDEVRLIGIGIGIHWASNTGALAHSGACVTGVLLRSRSS
jgi:hypothetical protein